MADDSKNSNLLEQDDLLSIKVTIGDALQLQDFSSDKQRYFVKLIGYLNKKSVLVSHPMNFEKLLFIKEGQSFAVRGFSGTKTYEFNANVLEVCLQPYPYLHLSFPAQVITTSMRSAMRVKLKLTCSVALQGTSVAKVPSIIEDMSISGMRVRANREFGAVSDEVKVSFRLSIDDEDHLFVVPAIIRNMRSDTDINSGSRFLIHGLELVRIEGSDQTVLQNYIYKTIAERK